MKCGRLNKWLAPLQRNSQNRSFSESMRLTKHWVKNIKLNTANRQYLLQRKIQKETNNEIVVFANFEIEDS